MKQKKLKVGFDLDGVLLYNPARIFRPITLALKAVLPKKVKIQTEINFYYPKSSLEKLIWKVVHLSSLFISPGVNQIEELASKRQIEPYIISSRYRCLQPDFNRWLKKLNAPAFFKGMYHNVDDLQPHIFKEKKINELKLDFFVEDNWDIVCHINKNSKTKALWITNIFDNHIDYDLKFLSLKKAMEFIKKKIR